LITSISHGRPASTSSSIDGRAPGIFSPNARAYATGSSKPSAIPRARATSYASCAQREATDQAAASASTSPIVHSRTAQVPLKQTLQTSFSQTSWSTSS
jgi:hypothetical protein